MLQINPGRHKAVHSDQLERWLGSENVAALTSNMRGWYGPPIGVAGVPGAVYAGGDGDFAGDLRAGYSSSWMDYGRDFLRRYMRGVRRTTRNGRSTANAGFSSLSDMISEMTVGNKRRDFYFNKVGTSTVTASNNTLWFVGSWPPAGAAAAAAPGGTVPTDATTGGFPFTNPTGGDTQHFVTGYMAATLANKQLLLYDRLFSVTKTMNSTATEAVTGVPTRYTSTTPSDPDYAGGNFLFVETRTALPATAHNWTVCTYTDQSGAASTMPSLTGLASCIINRLDHSNNSFFAPLESGDIGIKALTQMQCSALVASGAVDFTIGHPIALLPSPVANAMCIVDGINTAFNLVRIFDDACMAFLDLVHPGATATTFTGAIVTLAG